MNNLVRTYLMIGKIDAAKKFITTTKFKVDKSLVKRVENYSPRKFFIDESPEEESVFTRRKNSDDDSPKQRFTNEKILEDELVSQIESGNEVFGLKLKIYRRDGDFYGRQYPFSDGKKIIVRTFCAKTSAEIFTSSS